MRSQSSLEALPELTDPLLKRYCPSEARAILIHRYYLGLELKREPTLEDTIASWEARFARPWRREKALCDVAAQIREIERHKYHMSEQAGQDVGFETAAADWIRSHAKTWRDWWESQPASSP